MKWELAADNQLKNIMGFDLDCPSLLLAGVVEEAMNRNLLDGLMKNVIIKRFKSIEFAAKILKMPEEDLFQYCRMIIFETAKKHKSKKRSFLYFAFISLKKRLMNLVVYTEAKSREIYNHTTSAETKEGINITWLLPSGTNVEREVINKITLEERLEKLTESEKECLLLYAEGFSVVEIGESQNFHHTTANRKVNAALTKITGRKMTINDLQGGYNRPNKARGA